MPWYLVTEQEARVVERTFRVKADDDEHATHVVEELDLVGRGDTLKAANTIRMHVEIIEVKEDR